MDQGRALLLQTWSLLDEAVVTIMEPGDFIQDKEKKDSAKQQARAYANVLALFMQPFFTDADSVAREAIARYKARQAGTVHDTPGLAEHIWDMTKNWDGSERVLPGIENKKVDLHANERTLTPEEVTAVQNALASNMFTSEQLAEMFKTSVAVVETCRRG